MAHMVTLVLGKAKLLDCARLQSPIACVAFFGQSFVDKAFSAN
jgi:hypothetical protein